MSHLSRPVRARRAGALMAAGLAFAAAAPAAHAAPVDLATATPFVVLGGQSVTNTGPSVLGGDLGVAPGTSLVGFGFPAVVNGATHVNDAVAALAQDDVTTAYGVAAGQPVAPADDLTGQDLGGKSLTAGAYRYASSAQLTGQLTLDAEGDPDAQFVFAIGSTLTTASASSVVLVNGASPCNVFWQVGSSATLGSTTVFAGNVLALADISLNAGAAVDGRLLARDGSITLIDNVLDASMCQTPLTTPGTSGTGGGQGTGGTAATTPTGAVPASGAPAPAGENATPPSTVKGVTTQLGRGTATLLRTPRARCTAGFRATIRGRMIRSVVFSLDGRRIRGRTTTGLAARQIVLTARPGTHTVSARVTFTDGTRARTLTVPYRACAEALRSPRRGPSRFTG
jgi:hypothetical protein